MKLFSKLLALAMTLAVSTTILTSCKKDDADKMKSLTAMQAYEDMRIGWNVGNSLDAVGYSIDSETGWGNPKITKELIDSVKAAGFDTVRIPITWMGHFSNNEYIIEEEWLDRVEEVIDYVIDNDMYAMINIHHDGMDSHPSWLTPAPTDEEEMVKKFVTLWEQIANRYKSYGEKLFFAGMNEFHKGYDKPSSAYLALTNRLNQAFVDTVRATGGNNAERILIFQAYNTNAEAAMTGLDIPTDSAENRLMAEVHYYDPWDFAGSGKNSWGVGGPSNDSWGQEEWVDSTFKGLKEKFFDNGIPIVLGEYGAVRNRDGYDESRRYYSEYVTKAAKENGILPVWWDNGNDSASGEAFALFNRNDNSIIHQDLIDALMRATEGKDYEIEPAKYS